MNIKKSLISLTLASIMVLTGCGGKQQALDHPADDREHIAMSYYDSCTYEEGATLANINENLFYRNTYVAYETAKGADPAVMQITDENDPNYGRFVLTVTESSYGLGAYIGDDLVNWEPLGRIISADSNENTEKSMVLYHSIWAPEMTYDADEGKYYLFFSAAPKNNPSITGYANDSGSTTCNVFEKSYSHIPFVAVSDSYAGPFELVDSSDSYRYTDGTPMRGANGKEITKAATPPIEHSEIKDNAMGYSYFLKYSVFDPYQIWEAIKNSDDKYLQEILDLEPTQLLRSIDFHPFVDADGQKYLYFTCAKDAHYSKEHTSYIMGIKMNSWTDPDYSTLTRLTRYGYYQVGDIDVPGVDTPMAEKNDSRVNEGPWMTAHNGKYYLTLSINKYSNSSYKVIQAVSDSPLGPFRKLTEDEGGVLLAADGIEDVSGPGHHSIVEVDGQLYIVYHKHDDPVDGGSRRHIAVSEIEWVTITDQFGESLDVMYTNGPTNATIMPIPAFASGYQNIAPKATVSATNIDATSSADYLTDELIDIFTGMNPGFVNTYIRETEFTGETTITLSFDNYETIRAIMIYNSPWIENAFYEIERIEFDYDDNGTEKVKVIKNLAFDWQANSNQMLAMKTACSAIAEFNEIAVKEIRIMVKPATIEQIPLHDNTLEAPLGITEIVVLGK